MLVCRLIGLCFFAFFLGGPVGRFCTLAAQPTDYIVPHRMKLGNVQLRINRRARRAIEEKVTQLSNSPSGVAQRVRRAQLFFPIVERVLDEEQVPDAFKYLAIQESALVADAVSSSDAVGFWQFKYPAAHEVGLRMNKRVDERMHIEAATRGACRYLKQHQFFFKNWAYAMTAYYTGRKGAESYVEERYIGKKNMTIGHKTHWYVLHFLAHYIVYSEALSRQKKPLGIHLMEHKVEHGASLSALGKKFKKDAATLKEYNAWILRRTVPKDKEYIVYIPRRGSSPSDKRSDYAFVTSHQSREALREVWDRVHDLEPYVVHINGLPALVSRKGDRLEDLAEQGGLSYEKFLRYNDITENHQVGEGEIYYLKRKKRHRPIDYHIVQPSESLWHIAQLYGIRLKTLAKKNERAETEIPPPYIKIWLSRTRPPYDTNEPISGYSLVEAPQKREEDPANTEEEDAEKAPKEDWHKHRVAHGETLYRIAEQYGVRVEEIVRWNSIEHAGRIKIGQILYLDALPPQKESTLRPRQKVEKAADTEIERKKEHYITYRVRMGDTLYSIARRHKTSVSAIRALNKKGDNQLRVGEKLLLPASE